MNYSLYVDPSELKRDSKFMECGVKNYIPSAGLEGMTGADIMISPPNLPNPINEFLLKMHLEQGALLVQLKFSFDLIASIIDGRYKASQAKMLATGAGFNQIVLLFIGLVFEPEKKNAELMINGQHVRNVVPAATNFKFAHYLEQCEKWAQRGGVFRNIVLESSLKVWIESAAKVAFENEPIKQVWQPKQELILVNDWRNLLNCLPGLGEMKAQAIYNELENKSFYGFLAALEDGSLLSVPGVGPGIIEKIKNYLKGETNGQ